MSMAINNCSKVYPEELSEVAPQSLKPVCLPTEQQWKFATLIAAGLISASDAYRLVYPGRGRRQERTVWNHASALARHPKVVWAVAKIRAGDLVPTKVERMQQKAHAIFAQRAINRILGERGRRADVILSGRELSGPHPEEHPRKQAWRTFLRSCQAVQRAKESRLSHAEKVEIIFRHYAPPIVPPHLLTAPLHFPEPDPCLAELVDQVRAQQRALETERISAAPEPAPDEEQSVPQPGDFPHAMPVESASASSIATLRAVAASASPAPTGEWRLLPVPGLFPPRTRRVW